MRALVIGGAGMIGSHLVRALDAAGSDVTATYHHLRIPDARRLELSDFDAVARLLDRTAPDVVFLAAGPDLAAAERAPERLRLQLLALRNAVRALQGSDALVVAFSSDHVFDGTCGPYLEDEPTWPASNWGGMHQATEVLVSEEARHALVIRTSDVFGWAPGGACALEAIRRSLALLRPFEAAYDRVITPTHAPFLAEMAVALAAAGAEGVFHVAGPMVEETQFLQAMAEAFALRPGLVTSASYTQMLDPGPQPAHGGLVTARALDRTGLSAVPSHEEALASFAASEPAPAAV